MQMTDWLEPGGKERVAVNIANLLPRDRFDSFLCTTRRSNGASNRSSTRRRAAAAAAHAAVRLKAMHPVAFNASNRIDVLHAHGSSLFIASVASMFRPIRRSSGTIITDGISSRAVQPGSSRRVTAWTV
jgi:hypothetical protein